MATKTLLGKQVRETSAAQSLKAYVIINPKGHHCATVQAHFSRGGTCTVDVWEMAKGITHQGKAGGYGYDKFSAALSGAEIDSIKIYDHSVGVSDFSVDGINDMHPAMMAFYSKYRQSPLNEEKWFKAAKERGYQFANWNNTGGGFYQSLHYVQGLDRLKNFGYKVIQAI